MKSGGAAEGVVEVEELPGDANSVGAQAEERASCEHWWYLPLG